MGIIFEAIKESTKGVTAEAAKETIKKLTLSIVAILIGVESGKLLSQVIDMPTRIKSIESALRKNNRRRQ